MAEVTAMRNNATDYAVYGLPWTIELPILDADGDPVTDGTIDSLVSLNGDTAGAGATPVQIATTTGLFYLALTAANMTADIVGGSIGSTTSGAKRTLFTLYPRKLPVLLTSDNAGAYDSTTTINLGSAAVAVDDYYIGCLVYIYAGTGNGQVRMITDYVGSTKLATVHVAWATNPDATSDLKIYRTEQAPYVMGANVQQWLGGAARTDSATRGLAGTALPDAAADDAGGLPTTTKITDARLGALTDWIDAGRLDAILDAIATDVAGLDGAAMRGTDSAALATTVGHATYGLSALKDILDAIKGAGWTDETLKAIKAAIPAAAPSAASIVTELKDSTAWTAAGTATFKTIVKFLYAMAQGNFTISGSTVTLYDDNGSTVLGTFTKSATARTRLT